MVVSRDQRQSLVGFYRILARANPPATQLRLRGLNAELEYTIRGSGERFGGDELMRVGIDVARLGPMAGDFQSLLLELRAVDPGRSD